MSAAHPHRRRVADVTYVVGVAVVFFLAAHGLFQKITWYLAIDQYGYLTFAGDLARGRVFHEWAPIEALASAIPLSSVDVLAQTYVFGDGRMYCRYTPGFPMLLAAWMRVFGPSAAHYLDPILFLALLAVHHALARRLFAAVAGARWLALAGTVLLLLLPSYLHLWAITILRDVSAQVFAITAILVALPRVQPMSRRRAALVGLLLGYLISIRIDAGLFALPISIVFLGQARQRGATPMAAALFAVGVCPLLAYNYAATGNPLRATQAMELESFFEARSPQPPGPPDALVAGNTTEIGSDARSVATSHPPSGTRDGNEIGAPPPAPEALALPRTVQFDAPAGVPPPVHGGGLRLSNFPRIFPGNVRYLRNAFGNVILVLAVIGAIAALFTNRLLFVVAVPYAAAALLFYSCWARPDPRYIAGVFVLTPLLALGGLTGLGSLGAALGRIGGAVGGRILVAVCAGLLATLWFWLGDFQAAWLAIEEAWAAGAWRGGSALPVVGGGVAVIALVCICEPALRRPTAAEVAWPVAALALLLVSTAVVRALPGWYRRASFQAAEVAEARRTIEAIVAPGAVVITTDEIGRPAENIDYYTHAHALYLEDLARWRIPVRRATDLLLNAGHEVYFLVPSSSAQGQDAVGRLQLQLLDVTRVAHVAAQDAPRYFVASRFGTAPLDLYRVRVGGGS